MPLLLGEGRAPLTAARFMKERIAHAEQFPDLKSYLNVSDLIAYDSNKRSTDVKFILTVDKNGRVTEQGRKALELINPNVKLTSEHAVPLSNELYNSFSGIVVPKADLGVSEGYLTVEEVLESKAWRNLERNLTEEEILGSKIWRILARHPDEVPAEFAEDPALLEEYACWVKSQTKQDTNMGVYMDSNSKNAKLRAFYIAGLDGRSWLFGWNNLNVSGCLVGYLAPEALSVAGKGASNIKAYTMADL